MIFFYSLLLKLFPVLKGKGKVCVERGREKSVFLELAMVEGRWLSLDNWRY